MNKCENGTDLVFLPTEQLPSPLINSTFIKMKNTWMT